MRIFFRAGCILFVLTLLACAEAPKPAVKSSRQIDKSVGALGTLLPAGNLRNLTGNGVPGGGSQVVDELFVQEGDTVTKGQPLVVFRNYQSYLAQRSQLENIISTYRTQVHESSKLLKRFDSISKAGAYPVNAYQERVITHQTLLNYLSQAKIQLAANASNVRNSIIVSPINGVVTAIYSREGEAVSQNGVLQVGDLSSLYAKLEVYESDIHLIQPGQSVVIQSASGSFQGSVLGKVVRVIPGIRSRTSLPTTSVPNVDVRVGIVYASLNRNDIKRLRSSVGAKLNARIFL